MTRMEANGDRARDGAKNKACKNRIAALETLELPVPSSGYSALHQKYLRNKPPGPPCKPTANEGQMRRDD